MECQGARAAQGDRSPSLKPELGMQPHTSGAAGAYADKQRIADRQVGSPGASEINTDAGCVPPRSGRRGRGRADRAKGGQRRQQKVTETADAAP